MEPLNLGLNITTANMLLETRHLRASPSLLAQLSLERLLQPTCWFASFERVVETPVGIVVWSSSHSWFTKGGQGALS